MVTVQHHVNHRARLTGHTQKERKPVWVVVVVVVVVAVVVVVLDAIDDEGLFVIEGSQKLNSRKLRAAGNVCRNTGLVGKMSEFPCETATEASTVHTSERVHVVLAAIVGNTARGAISPAKPAECMSLPWRRRKRPLPSEDPEFHHEENMRIRP